MVDESAESGNKVGVSVTIDPTLLAQLDAIRGLASRSAIVTVGVKLFLALIGEAVPPTTDKGGSKVAATPTEGA